MTSLAPTTEYTTADPAAGGPVGAVGPSLLPIPRVSQPAAPTQTATSNEGEKIRILGVSAGPRNLVEERHRNGDALLLE